MTTEENALLFKEYVDRQNQRLGEYREELKEVKEQLQVLKDAGVCVTTDEYRALDTKLDSLSRGITWILDVKSNLDAMQAAVDNGAKLTRVNVIEFYVSPDPNRDFDSAKFIRIPEIHQSLAEKEN